MPWTVLLFAAGSLAIPAPAIFLVPPYPSSQEDPIHISCTAPKDFLGVNFTLYREGQVVQLLQAPADQLGVTFNLSGGGEAPGGKFHCQYSVIGEHSQTQLSDLSQTVHVSFPVPTWILALWLSLAGALLLLTGLAAFAVVVRRVKVKKLQKKREQESCWAQINFTTTENDFRRRHSSNCRCLPWQLWTAKEAHLHVILTGAPRIQHFPGMPVRLRIGNPFYSAPPAWAFLGLRFLSATPESAGVYVLWLLPSQGVEQR
ncbi:protein HIDE1 isoform X1 [Sciurus carolinensis]|uniref:protein HIDE1 isoform X1 n=1 Tax=Sciurus carolinensis TaxID=30640 RepID=UPI001FB45F70|nr:protein HIDE1 isoform X1 [Sciurus carolinensis]XP_047387598.1 protein HIDE1 isoform X1 [Sciurus carolinensis]